jgi:hypothetical protein
MYTFVSVYLIMPFKESDKIVFQNNTSIVKITYPPAYRHLIIIISHCSGLDRLYSSLSNERNKTKKQGFIHKCNSLEHFLIDFR